MPNRLAVRIKGDFFGYIEGDIFVKEVIGSRHKLKTLDAWALDADSFDKIIRPSCRELIIIDKENSIRYHSTLANFLANRGEVDFKHGRQYFMVIRNWTKI